MSLYETGAATARYDLAVLGRKTAEDITTDLFNYRDCEWARGYRETVNGTRTKAAEKTVPPRVRQQPARRRNVRPQRPVAAGR